VFLLVYIFVNISYKIKTDFKLMLKVYYFTKNLSNVNRTLLFLFLIY